MAGSHRAPEMRPSKLGMAPVIAIVVGLVLLLTFVVWTIADDGDSPPAATPPADSTRKPSPAPTFPTLTPSPVAPIDDLPRIPGAPPRRLIVGEAVDASFTNAIDSDEDVLEAPSATKLARLEGRGEPGSPGKDTVVIIGQDRFDKQAVLNDIAEVSKDDAISLETYNARLTYTVEGVFKVASESVRNSTSFRDTRPGRLLLIATTYDDSGERTGTDTVVVAHLIAAEKA